MSAVVVQDLACSGPRIARASRVSRRVRAFLATGMWHPANGVGADCFLLVCATDSELKSELAGLDDAAALLAIDIDADGLDPAQLVVAACRWLVANGGRAVEIRCWGDRAACATEDAVAVLSFSGHRGVTVQLRPALVR